MPFWLHRKPRQSSRASFPRKFRCHQTVIRCSACFTFFFCAWFSWESTFMIFNLAYGSHGLPMTPRPQHHATCKHKPPRNTHASRMVEISSSKITSNLSRPEREYRLHALQVCVSSSSILTIASLNWKPNGDCIFWRVVR